MIFPLLLIFVTLLGYFLPHSLQGAAQRNQLFPLLNTDSIGQLSGR